MTKIHRTNRDGSRWHEDLSSWATRNLLNTDTDGRFEDLAQQVRNIAHAVGLLAERLVQNGQMTTKEFLELVNAHEYPEPEFVQTEK